MHDKRTIVQIWIPLLEGCVYSDHLEIAHLRSPDRKETREYNDLIRSESDPLDLDFERSGHEVDGSLVPELAHRGLLRKESSLRHAL